MKRFFLYLVFLISFTQASNAQLLGLKSNLLKDAACMPNLAIEFGTGGRSTLSLEAFGSTKVWGHRFKTIGVAPELRWWFGGRSFNRYFLGIGVKAIHYDFEWKHERRRGDATGLGLTFGYDFYLSHHFSLDLSAGIGAMGYWQQHCYDSDALAPINYREKGVNLVPYQVGLSLIYIIK